MNNGNIDLCAKIISSGEVVIIGTDTVFGLACLANNKQSVTNIFNLKKRHHGKSIACFLSQKNDIYRYCGINNQTEVIINKFIPGAITIVCNAIDGQLSHITCNNGKLGIRIPDDVFCQQLTLMLGQPIAVTSANISGDNTTVDVSYLKSHFKNIPIFNINTNQKNQPSTVIDCSSDKITLLREGAIPFCDIQQAINI